MVGDDKHCMLFFIVCLYYYWIITDDCFVTPFRNRYVIELSMYSICRYKYVYVEVVFTSYYLSNL